jgi:Family of unknown function (DUF6232)
VSQENVGTIRITHRLLELGGQIYPLANIARIQNLRIEWSRKVTTGREIAVFALVLFIVTFALPGLMGVRNTTPWTVVLVLGALIVLVYRAVSKQRRQVLVIETSGGQSTALASKTREEIDRLQYEIAAAIENPPTTERLIHLSGDIVMGDKVGRDQYQQSGTGNNFNFN